MKTYILRLPAAEVVYLLRAETEARHGQPELNTGAEKDYIIDEDFDRRAYGFHDGEKFDLVTSRAILNIEPRVESGYWILEAIVERALGPLPTSEQDELALQQLTLDEFEEELRRPGAKQISVRLHVETTPIRQDFDRWLAKMQARHPRKAQVAPADVAISEMQQREVSMTEEITSTESGTYLAREAVAVFTDPNALEAAVDELEVSGFDRAAISVLATDAKARGQIDCFYQTVKEVEDSSCVSRGAFVSSESRTEGTAAVVGLPLYIGGFAGALAVTATGGALALAIAAAIAGGAAGAGLGAVLAATIARQHAARVKAQLEEGGLVLWVTVSSPDAEQRAVAVLNKVGARDVHVHEIQRTWGIKDIPFSESQPDPFLFAKVPE